MSELAVTILMPCLNEAETLAVCVRKARAAIEATGLPGEVLIADNGSADGSQAIAVSEGARVLPVARRGYGAALLAGIAGARGRYILMADADDSYDFGHLPRFLESLDAGNELVMGNRFKGGIFPDAMPPLHRFLGNPVLSFIGRLFFHISAGDFHCGIRAFRKDSIQSLRLQTTGMEFASEMVVKAALMNLRIAEVPTTLKPDGRSRAPHLRTWRDGWRHLRFLLMYSPRWLFFYPGAMLALLGAAATGWLLPAERHIGHLSFDVDSLTYAIGLLLIGVHIMVFAVAAKLFGTRQGFLPPTPAFERAIRLFRVESGIVLGAILMTLGLGLGIWAVAQWHAAGFGALSPTRMLRVTLPSAASIMLGVEVIFSSFLLGLFQIHHQAELPMESP
jgi:glycosyltransferase involved in cell wall biosynthesis